nr:alpha/beta hydrolases superfamily protein [Tanacetum cinerariifolium]GEX29327.1 alpha/beta hydrolases superfamily protein [Tanacetum cinerariifolium]
MAIEGSKDLTSLSLDELTENLKVHEMIIKKDSVIVKAKGERKSLALKAKKESSDEECSTSESEDEEYAMATFKISRDDKNNKSDRKCFRCGDPNHLIGECPKPLKDKNQRAIVKGSWSDSGEEDDEKVKDETCLVAQASSEDKSGLGFNSFEASSSRIKEIKFLKSQKDTSSDGGPPIAEGGPKNAQTTPKSNQGPPVCTSTYILNQILIRAILGKTPYELFRDYSQNSKAYIILNKHTMKIKESLNVTFDETPTLSKILPLVDDDLDEEEAIKVTEKKNLENGIKDKTLDIDEVSILRNLGTIH